MSANISHHNGYIQKDIIQENQLATIWLLASADRSPIEHLQFKMQLLAVDNEVLAQKLLEDVMMQTYIIISLFQLTTTVQLQLSRKVPNY